MKRWLVATTLTLAALLLATAFATGFRPAAADVRPFFGVLAAVSCSSMSACQSYTNSGSGPGVNGTSAKGNGVAGATKFNSTSAANGTVGVLGQDLSKTGIFNVGVKGTSTSGTGVLGVSNSGIDGQAGVTGLMGLPSGQGATTTGAVFGDSHNFSGVLGTSANVQGVFGASTHSDGVAGFTYNGSAGSASSKAGVHGTDASTDGGRLNAGVTGTSTNGIGVVGSSGFVGVNAVGGFINGGQVWPALSVVNQGDALSIATCQAADANPCDLQHAKFLVTPNGTIFANGVQLSDGITVGGAICCLPSSGNVNITGQYLVSGKCVAGCAVATATTAGTAVATYSAQTTSPTVEDFGEAQLVNGRAYVEVDASFANVIDQQRTYLVFITPEGDNRGLYVLRKTLKGFEVRESQGGRSSIAFSYRIVAKPYANDRPRLPMLTLPARGSSGQIRMR